MFGFGGCVLYFVWFVCFTFSCYFTCFGFTLFPFVDLQLFCLSFVLHIYFALAAVEGLYLKYIYEWRSL